jgi:RHS repeat-associated protein
MSATASSRSGINAIQAALTPSSGGSGEPGGEAEGVGKIAVQNPFKLPSVSLPKGGGAIKGIGEKFSVSPATGTGNFSVPVATSPGRGDSSIKLELSYNSGSGNSPFGLGWQISSQSIARKTDKGLPQYGDGEHEDEFMLSGTEDLVPVQSVATDGSLITSCEFREQEGVRWHVERYQPRIESGFLRILRFSNTRTGDCYWEVKTDSNVTTIFGDSKESRIADPLQPLRVFEWLPSRTYDDKGNMTMYEYKSEDCDGLKDISLRGQNNTDEGQFAARYIKRIKYGNTISRLSSRFKTDNEWLFEVVFDYGDHDKECPTTQESLPWRVRPDPFSSRRAGFNVRMYRLCARVLMFHHFADEPGVGRDCVVASLNIDYEYIDKDAASGYAVASLISSVKQEYWQRFEGGYKRDFMPPLDFTYSRAQPAKQSLPLESSSLLNLPAGLSGDYQLVDLEGQGLPGVVLRIDGSLQYIPNNGNGKFGPASPYPSNPSAIIRQGSEQWMDLDGSGRIELVQLNGSMPGYYKRNWDNGAEWDSFRTFASFPNLNLEDKRVKLIDLTGDGIADIVIANDELLTIYGGLGDSGFGNPSYRQTPMDDASGSRLVFWDGKEAIFTADMTGDGLTDLVRIRNSEVSYWPNLGYGKFDNKVIMANSPVFDYPELFDQAHLRLSDIDGSGTTDIIYLAGDTPTMYHNLSGNGWTSGTPVLAFPGIDSTTNIQVTDLLGRGTACLVWSSNLPGDFGSQIQYLDLMEAGKPYLLVGMVNNMGWETRLTYESSTQFYARDKRAGRPWTSHLPFPVQCVERSESVDRVSKSLFTTRYAYHDGYFDGIEREFRGFGMVESWDTELYSTFQDGEHYSNFSKRSNLPPVLTKTWYHTGQYLNGKLIAKYPDVPFWGSDGTGHGEPGVLPSVILPESIATKCGEVPFVPDHGEMLEACRALRGQMIRSEVYALDGSKLQNLPYLIKESSMHLELRQPRGQNQHAVFFVRPKESVEIVYDRRMYQSGTKKVFDPRIVHTLTLETDFYGNPLSSVVIAYGRKFDDPDCRLHSEDREAQRKTCAVLSTNKSTNNIDNDETYLLPRPAQSHAYELINISGSGTCSSSLGAPSILSFETAIQLTKQLSTGIFDIPFDNFIGPYPSKTTIYRRLLKESQKVYRRDDFKGPLPLGEIESLGLPWKNFQLVLTDSQAQSYVTSGKILSEELRRMLEDKCKFVRLPGRNGWWAPSGEAFFSSDREGTAEAELQEAKEHFFVIRRSRSQFDTHNEQSETFYDYDRYDLLVQEARDPFGNRVTAGERDSDPSRPLVKTGNDYRLLVPFLSMDSNRNRSEVAFDVLGNVVAAAAMGKPEEDFGDSLRGIKANLDTSEIKKFYNEPISCALNLLGKATSRTVYDFFSYYRTRHHSQPQPNWAASLSRETHESDLPNGSKTRVFTTFSYADGLGRSIQTKAQCEPGPLTALVNDPVPEESEAKHALTRWLASSWTILNNKNKPVRQYEPFFSDTHKFQDRAIHGMSKVMLYDAVARPIAVLSPNHTWTKTTFDPWKSEEWDKQDTILISDPSADDDVGPFFTHLPRDDYMPTWYAQRCDGHLGNLEKETAIKSAVLANTPTTKFFDSLGRVCVTFDVHRRPPTSGQRAAPQDELLRQPSFLDVQGLPGKIVDALQRNVARNVYSIGGWVIAETHMDSGTKWTLPDSVGGPILTWNARGDRFRTEYDRSRRVIGMYVTEGGNEYLVEKSVYGETAPDVDQYNARGRIIHAFDQSGITKTPKYNYKGNLQQSSRQLTSDYKGTIDWATGQVTMEAASYVEQVWFDALGKPTRTVLPDGTVTLYRYNERGLTKSVETTVAGSPTATEVITDIKYDAKGQRTTIMQENGVKTQLFYDKETFRNTRILTIRNRTRRQRRGSVPGDSDSSSKSPQRRGGRVITEKLQDLKYVYDVIGNVTHVTDDASKTVFFRNNKIDASQTFTYDSLSRLVEATGREHIGQMYLAKDRHAVSRGVQSSNGPNDRKAMGHYVETYSYDAANNIQRLHHANLTEGQSQTRRYFYEEKSLVDPAERNNRLSRTLLGDVVEQYRYGNPEAERGHMTAMPGIPCMTYDYAERMATSAQTASKSAALAETTYYRYDATGKRVRKVVERQLEQHGSTVYKETIYIGGAFEVFKRYKALKDVAVEAKTARIIESGRQLLLIENVSAGEDGTTKKPLYRYQLGNFQGSASVEVDQDAQILTYEEFTPYGISTVRAIYRETDVPKRYRFLGKERDCTGLYHFGLRYYAAWLGRFISSDPKGAIDGSNLYQYSHGNPNTLADTSGTAAKPVPTPPLESLGWTDDVIRSRARDWIVFENLPSWVSGLREWRIYGRLAAGDFAHMLQNQFMAEGRAAADVYAKFEQYLPNAETGQRVGSSFIDFMLPALKKAYEHKLLDFENYSEKGTLIASKVSDAFTGSEGIIAQLEKHTANIAAKFGAGWGQTRLAVTIRGVERASPGWNAITGEISAIMHKAGQLEPLFAHIRDPALMTARGRLDAAAMAFINKAGGLAKYVGKGARVLGPLAVGASIVLAPFQAHAAMDSNETVGNRTQAGLDLGSGVTGIGVAAIATKSAAITATGGATAAAAAGVVVAGAALGGAAAGAALGGYVAETVENTEWAQKNLGETGAAVAGASTGVLAGAAAGAAVGALVGSALPVVGTLAGAAIGGAAGALGAGAKILINKYWP